MLKRSKRKLYGSDNYRVGDLVSTIELKSVHGYKADWVGIITQMSTKSLTVLWTKSDNSIKVYTYSESYHGPLFGLPISRIEDVEG